MTEENPPAPDDESDVHRTTFRRISELMDDEAADTTEDASGEASADKDE